MNPEPPPDPPPPGDDLPQQLASFEEFKRWVEEHPEDFNQMQQTARRAALGEFGDLTPEMLEAVKAFVASCRVIHAVSAVHAKMMALQALMARPPGTMDASDRIAQANRLMDELMDAALETPEPHRTKFLEGFVSLREEVRALKLEE